MVCKTVIRGFDSLLRLQLPIRGSVGFHNPVAVTVRRVPPQDLANSTKLSSLWSECGITIPQAIGNNRR